MTSQENLRITICNEEGVDKAPGEERNKGEKVKPEDQKGKKVDADPSQKKDRPTN